MAWKPEQAGLTSDREPHRDSPNVIQIVIDTLGGKYLDPGLLEQYPAFTELAKDGFQFVRAYSTASCTSWSVPAILTSSFNFVSSGRQFDEFGWLDENEITTAEIFKEAGYETVGFSANPVTSEAFDYNQGFDHFRGIKGGSLLGVYILKALGTQNTKFAYQYGLVDSGFYYQDIKDLYYKLESYLSQNHARPFYIYVQTMDLHAPYMPPKEYLDSDFRFDDFRSHWELSAMKKTGKISEVPEAIRKNALQLYLGELKYTDEYLAKLIQLLKRLNLYDNTMIVVTSDHGEEFWEHDSYAHCSTKAYDELIRVPLFIKPPGSAEIDGIGSVMEENVSTLDILPTMVDLANINLAPSQKEHFEGRSLLPLIQEKSDNMNHRMLYGIERNLYFAIQKRWKLLWRGKAKKFELYDLEQDPLEKEDVFLPRQSSVKDAVVDLSVFASSFNTETEYEKGNQKLDPSLEEKLRSLGYVQ
ncbi:MAG TPA: sulfatase [Thermodesulfobacteriota bacterium]|nr:sulfatase [Thermodesulfobacteriota bacterium]